MQLAQLDFPWSCKLKVISAIKIDSLSVHEFSHCKYAVVHAEIIRALFIDMQSIKCAVVW